MPEKNPSQTFQLLESSTIESVIPKHEIPWLWIALACAVIAGLLAIVIYQRRKRAKDPANICKTAFNEALVTLDAISSGDAHAAALQSSLAIRKYLSIAAKDPALFETHEEFVSRHDALQKIPLTTREKVTAVFSQLATIKYAPNASNANAANIVDDSRQILQALHTALAP